MEIAANIVQQLPVFWQALVMHAPSLVGLIMPVFIQFVTTRLKHDEEKVWTSVAMCFVVSVLFNWNTLQYGTLDQIVASFGIVFAESHVVFITFFRSSPFRSKMMQVMGIGENELPGNVFIDQQTKTASPELG